MYLPMLSNEELIRYGEGAAETDMERELIKRLDECLQVNSELQKELNRTNPD